MTEQNCGLSPRWDVRDLGTILGMIWDDWHEAIENPGHEWGLPTLASFGVEGVEVRTVVLRDANRSEGQLVCFTDVRSPKVEQFRADCRAAWHFYNRAERVQVVAKGAAEVLTTSEEFDRYWSKSQLSSRVSYLAPHPPSRPTDQPNRNRADLLIGDENEPLRPERLEAGKRNFAVIRTVVTAIDWLGIGKSGNLRARFCYRGSKVTSTWVLP